MIRLAQVNIQANYFANHPNAAKLGTSPGSLITALLPNIIVIAGIVFLFIIIMSGYNIVVNAGGSNAQVISKHKNTFIQALIGFLIVVGAFFILQIVGATVGVNFINPTI
jgi:hypothetical protein